MNSVCQEEAMAIQNCQSGATEAFEFIVKRSMTQAYSISLGLVGNRDDAMELSQEAFFRAYSNINQLNPKRKFFPWFYQILRNLCFSHLRKRIRRQRHDQQRLNDCAPETETGQWFDPQAVAQRNELKDRVWEAISRLDEKHREVIVLRHFQNMAYEQIAQTLLCNRGTVMSRLYHARRKLKEILDNKKGGPQV